MLANLTLAVVFVNSKQDSIIRNYLGFGILSQAGVAIGLAILAANEFGAMGPAGEDLAIAVVNTIAATTILFEIIGPIGAKFAIAKAGEIGANITEQDLIQTYNVADVMQKDIPSISAGMSLSNIMQVVSGTESFYYPVVDNDKKLIGAVTLDGIRNTFATQELNDWLVALDIMEPVVCKIAPDVPLQQALQTRTKLDVEYVPVVSRAGDQTLKGVLSFPAVRRRISAEVLHKQRRADSLRSSAPAV